MHTRSCGRLSTEQAKDSGAIQVQVPQPGLVYLLLL